jgi:hypothetical protein
MPGEKGYKNLSVTLETEENWVLSYELDRNPTLRCPLFHATFPLESEVVTASIFHQLTSSNCRFAVSMYQRHHDLANRCDSDT